uniref:Cytochrome b6-f complex subunit VII n=1 Tax=Pleurocladia lacustris TaxID=246121 RepID=A0A1I9LW27_9PHAE|nr:cytochrome b6-f complex subunit VII [Pleurocladia lacustris]ANS57653.1 cytochrome b6-f complex subunit VII [Pleurocladia lacustris]ANS57797.1 cytochrome b6-f complex subunit VII [Pleurocladia lacustris]
MNEEILSISILCFSMVIIGLYLGFLLLKLQQ